MNSNNVLVVAFDDDVEEVRALIKTLGLNPLSFLSIKSRRVDNNFYLSRGRLAELKDLITKYGIVKVYIYDELKPRHVVNLMKELKVDIADKINLILEIFALHAGSKEAKLQIEMMRLRHELPLIKEWIRRAKLGELPGFLSSGGYATDAYYYGMRKRYARIKKELIKLRDRRYLERVKRSSHGFPQVAISGYTNAGKTTLFNVLTNESKPVGQGMFTTVSPKVKGTLINGRKVIFVDTVGFIRKVPTDVIEAFYATLEEIVESNLNIMLLDSTEPPNVVVSKLKSSLEVLIKIGYVGKPLIVALNKVDVIDDDEGLVSRVELVKEFLRSNYKWEWEVIPISALKSVNIDLLKDLVSKYLEHTLL